MSYEEGMNERIDLKKFDGAEKYVYEGERLGVDLVRADMMDFKDAKRLMDDKLDYLRSAGIRISCIESDSIDGMIEEAEGSIINYYLDDDENMGEVIDELDCAVERHGYTGTVFIRRDGFCMEYCAGYDPLGIEVSENEGGAEEDKGFFENMYDRLF